MSEVSFTPTGPPATRLPVPPTAVAEALERGDRPADVTADNPESLEAWAALGDSLDPGADAAPGQAINAYAAYRVGYHRGLDALRRNGWKGSGYVRWDHEPNRAFLRCLDGLRRMAAQIGETAEADRCDEFLGMLEPDWRSYLSD